MNKEEFVTPLCLLYLLDFDSAMRVGTDSECLCTCWVSQVNDTVCVVRTLVSEWLFLRAMLEAGAVASARFPCWPFHSVAMKWGPAKLDVRFLRRDLIFTMKLIHMVREAPGPPPAMPGDWKPSQMRCRGMKQTGEVNGSLPHQNSQGLLCPSRRYN